MLWFDLDDTLWAMTDNSTGVLRSLWTEIPVIRKAYPEGPDKWLDVYHRVNAELWRDYAKALISRPHLRLERFARPLVEGGIPRKEAESASGRLDGIYLDLLGSCPGLLPGARELLEKVEASPLRKPGIISNGFKEVQHRKLVSSGIEKYFSAVILSDDIGITKPDRRIFDHALAVTATRAEDSIIAGDNPLTDILGALQAGWGRAIWFNPSDAPMPEELAEYPSERLQTAASADELADLLGV